MESRYLLRASWLLRRNIFFAFAVTLGDRSPPYRGHSFRLFLPPVTASRDGWASLS
jgi:hypothetical protein